MTNKEKNKNEIVDIATEGDTVGIDKETLELISCGDLGCLRCLFYNDNYPVKQGDCVENLRHWMNSEYAEPKKFTQQEQMVLNICDKINWLARDEDGDLYGFVEKPIKKDRFWGSENQYVLMSKISSCKFEAIKWEDKEPVSREEILRCVND